MTTLSTFLPSRKIEPESVNANWWVASVFKAARASMMNGSHRRPAKTRMSAPEPPCGSFTRNETVPPVGEVQMPSCTGTSAAGSGVEKTQSKTYSSSAGTNRQPFPFAVGRFSGRNLKRYRSPSENRSEGLAIGSVFTTSTRRSGCSGLGNAYTSVMSAIGFGEGARPRDVVRHRSSLLVPVAR